MCTKAEVKHSFGAGVGLLCERSAYTEE